MFCQGRTGVSGIVHGCGGLVLAAVDPQVGVCSVVVAG